ncbi:MAG: nucleotidyltransferase family protein [Oscillospiraceae bacterium]|jgi:molybdenum cofactor cytidylyltransferase|nr:nucleotidyltransferase family protein [Oscillospiraceae bacterium]
MQEYKIGCALLAAGNSLRFGANKLCALLNGKSIIRRAMEAIPAQLFCSVVVVTQYAEIAALAEEFGFCALENSNPSLGISHSVRLATQALSYCDGILFLVGDQPQLSADSVSRLVQMWKQSPNRIACLGSKGTRGNPNLFPREFFAALLSLQGDCGGSSVIKAHPDRLTLLEVAENELLDVDTPQALRSMEDAEPPNDGQ